MYIRCFEGCDISSYDVKVLMIVLFDFCQMAAIKAEQKVSFVKLRTQIAN